MPRIRIELPSIFTFSCTINLRITDVNYGGHVGNDTILSLIHEARVQFLRSLGYTELELGGTSLIMADAGIEYKNELFYGDDLNCEIAVTEKGKVHFDIVYQLSTIRDGKKTIIANAKTGMVCYDYSSKKVSAIPAEVLSKL